MRLEIPAVDQLERQEVAPARDAEVQHLRDVAVLEAHRDVRLVQHHVAELRIGRIRRQDPLEDDRLLETLGAVLDGQENLGHAAVGELAQDCVAAVRGHSRRLGYHPPTAGWRPTASESTTATTTRAAREHETSRETRAALQAAMGVAPETAAPPLDEPDAVRVLLPGGDRSLHGWRPAAPTWCWRTAPRVRSTATARCRTSCRSVTTASIARGGDETLLIVSPGRCFLPDDLRAWGFAAQLYAARSRDSWGIGDLADLTRLGRWTREPGRRRADGQSSDGARRRCAPIEASPYYPSSRRYRNPLFLRIEELPGWDELPGDLRARLTNAGTALNRERRIDRDAIFRLKQEALEALFAAFPRRAGLRLVLRRRGPGADRLRHLRGAGRAARQGLAAVAGGLPPPRRRRRRRLPRRAERAHPLPRLDAVADRQPARARVERDRASSTTCRSASTSRAPTPGAGRT